MSLINKMLQDLDSRHAMASAEGALPPQQVRAVGGQAGHEWFWRIIAALILAAIGWVAWVAWQLQARPVATELAYKAGEEARIRALSKAPPAPVAQAPKPPAEASKPAAPAASFRLALAIDTPINERASRPAGKAKEPAEASKQKSAGEIAKARDDKLAGRASVAEEKKALASLALDVPPARVLPTPPAAAPRGESRVEKRDRTRSPADRAEAEFRRAVALLNQGRISEAEEGLTAALGLDPAHEAARQALVALHIERRQLDAARRLLQEGLAVNPAQTAFSIALSRIFVERRDYAAALDALQASTAETAGNAEYQAMRGNVLQRLGRHREATEAYQNALRAQPANPHAWIGLGISHEALADRTEAAEAFRRSLATGPLSTELRNFAEQRIRALQ
ncbi:MAG: tetratricopeptide repeat protein [Betaproteobacteria bacterium]|nr:tetratricopeptide repeat protein [Betaproteobacteria bacterium]